jgi:hypothetical protein
MPLDLTDEETAALEQLLCEAIGADRYFLSPPAGVARDPNKIHREPPREPLPPLRYYEPPRARRSRGRCTSTLSG